MPLDILQQGLIRNEILQSANAREAMLVLHVSVEHFTDRVLALLEANSLAQERNWNNVPHMTVAEAIRSAENILAANQRQQQEDIPRGGMHMETLNSSGGKPGRRSGGGARAN